MVTGAVLAGGTSSRFGSEKATAQFGRCPMIAHVVSVLRLVADDIIVAVAPGRSSYYTKIVDEDVRVVEDKHRDQGPIRGLVTALEASCEDYVIVSPCDTPLLRKEVCELIIDRGRDRDGAVPRIGGFFEPLHAVYKREPCLQAFARVIEEGDMRPKEAYGRLDLATVEEEELRGADPDLVSFININSEEDLAKATGRHEAK